MKKLIKAGIRLEITSYEGDADNFNTELIDGLTDDEAKFYIEFASLFKSCNRHTDIVNFGNARNLSDKQFTTLTCKVEKIINKYPAASRIHQHNNIKDFTSELSYDILGCCEHVDFRVFHSYRAYRIPSDIEEITIDIES